MRKCIFAVVVLGILAPVAVAADEESASQKAIKEAIYVLEVRRGEAKEKADQDKIIEAIASLQKLLQQAQVKPGQPQPPQAGSPIVAAGDMGQQIVKFVKDNFGKKVGTGECADLANHALQSVGAKTSRLRRQWPRQGLHLGEAGHQVRRCSAGRRHPVSQRADCDEDRNGNANPDHHWGICSPHGNRDREPWRR